MLKFDHPSLTLEKLFTDAKFFLLNAILLVRSPCIRGATRHFFSVSYFPALILERLSFKFSFKIPGDIRIRKRNK
jgi:hypothetical protein